MSNSEEKKNMLDNESISREWLEQMMHNHPYYIVPILQYIKQHPEADDHDDLLARLAIAHAVRLVLATLLGEGL